MKNCRYCKQDKPLSAFYKAVDTKDRLSNKCKDCVNSYSRQRYFEKKDELNERRRTYLSRNSQVRRTYKLQSEYGITWEEYVSLLESQLSKCAICGRMLNAWATKKGDRGAATVDHDHVTGLVRGLLCHSCNTALGLFGDNIQNLLSAIKYLQEHNPQLQLWLEAEIDK